MLKLKQALGILEKVNARGLPIPCSIVFCTADSSRGTGGEIISMDKVILSRHNKKKIKGYQGPLSAKQPTHHRNRTRNIMQVGTTEIRKIHIDLILFINGEAVA